MVTSYTYKQRKCLGSEFRPYEEFNKSPRRVFKPLSAEDNLVEILGKASRNMLGKGILYLAAGQRPSLMQIILN